MTRDIAPMPPDDTLHRDLLDAVRFTAWDEVAQWIRDEPELHPLGGVERLLLLGAAMHRDLEWTSRDVRRAHVEAERGGELLVRAPALNPYVVDDCGLASPWDEGRWLRASLARDASAAHVWLQRFAASTSGRCEGARAQVAFGEAVFEMLARDLGAPARWRTYTDVTGDPLKTAYCCGYDAIVVRGESEAVLLVTGMYC